MQRMAWSLAGVPHHQGLDHEEAAALKTVEDKHDRHGTLPILRRQVEGTGAGERVRIGQGNLRYTSKMCIGTNVCREARHVCARPNAALSLGVHC